MSETGGRKWKTDVPRSTTKTMAVTNSGSAASASRPTEVVWSKMRSRQRAATEPSTIESGTLMTAEISIRNPEFSSREPITEVTGTWVPVSERPRSPLRKPPSQ